MSDIKEDFNANLLTAEGVDAVIITGTNGKEYRIEKKLPTKAGNIFNTYMAKYGINEPETADEIIKAVDKKIEFTIATLIAANEMKYPELTRAAIIGTEEKPGIFESEDLEAIYTIYLLRWLEIINRKMKSETTDNNKKKEAAEKDV